MWKYNNFQRYRRARLKCVSPAGPKVAVSMKRKKEPEIIDLTNEYDDSIGVPEEKQVSVNKLWGKGKGKQ